MMIGSHDPVADEVADVLDDLATLATGDDLDAIRGRYPSDDRLRVPPDISKPVEVRLAL
jgi:hypothetical protein